MLKALKFLLPLLLIFLTIGCSNESDLGITNPTATTDEPVGVSLAAKTMIPEGAHLVSATLYLNIDFFSDQRIDVHRATAPWVENTVTWNSFGGAYDAAIDGSFMADGQGWRSVEITGLVQGWLDSDYPNYGLLLDQEVMPWPRTLFYSRETSLSPYLELCFDDGSGCEQIVPIADVFIREYDPDQNFDHMDQLWTGNHTEVDPEMQSLILFDLPTAPPGDEGCTHNACYWKMNTSSCYGDYEDLVTPLLPIWLGDEGGRRSVRVYHRYQAKYILGGRYGHPRNGIVKLYAQLLAAKLNIASGASDDAVAGVIADADVFLAGHARWKWWRLSPTMKNTVLGWKDILGDYNRGIIGPGHCDD